MGNDYETGLDRTDRLLINLIHMIRLEEDPMQKGKYQKIVDIVCSKKQIEGNENDTT